MSFFHIYLLAFLLIICMMTLLWIVSVFLKNVSIVDIFWGIGFIVAALCYNYYGEGNSTRKLLVTILVSLWGLRLAIHLAVRNWGKGEDYRYQEFRRKYGETKYWWISFFHVFLLQGTLMWIISAPLLGAQYLKGSSAIGFTDYIAFAVWLVGFVFEAGGDIQLARFRANKENKGKLLSTGFWKFTRHPNYFGDSAVWWAYGLFSIAGSMYFPFLSSLLMTALIIRISGVMLLEKNLKEKKPGYIEYMKNTSSFLPWFPKNDNKAKQ